MEASSGTIVVSQDVLARELRGETVLLDLKSDNYFGVAEVAARAWQLINAGTNNLRDLTTRLAAEYDVSEETLTRDLTRFINDLVDAGLVTTVQTPAVTNA